VPEIAGILGEDGGDEYPSSHNLHQQEATGPAVSRLLAAVSGAAEPGPQGGIFDDEITEEDELVGARTRPRRPTVSRKKHMHEVQQHMGAWLLRWMRSVLHACPYLSITAHKRSTLLAASVHQLARCRR
jgi:hypothetical protein